MAHSRSTRLDTIFEALAEPTRRAVLERLALAGATVTELAEPFPMSLQAFLKHIRALEEAGLVQRVRIGRTNHVTIVPEALQAAASWLVARTPATLPAQARQVTAERQSQLVQRARGLHASLEGRMAILRSALDGPATVASEFRPEVASVRALVATGQVSTLVAEAVRLHEALGQCLAALDRAAALENEGAAAELPDLVLPLGRLMFELRPLLPVEPAIA